MEGTIVNAVAVLGASGIGLLLNKKLPERFHKIVFQAIGLFTLFLGAKLALESNKMLLVILSLTFGGLIGEGLRIEDRITFWSEKLKNKLKLGNPQFTKGFMTATLLFCVGTMSILGSIQDGLGQEPELLYTKSVLDGFSALILTVAYGIGVAFSVIPMVIYQGLLTLLAVVLDSYLSPPILAELTSVGGVMIIGIGINLLEIKQLRIMNLLPALIVVVVLSYFFA
jgi:uncharacterized membrane protein YqgA involved in biofilm formation